MDTPQEYELKLPLIVAAENGVKAECAHCHREIVTMNPVEAGLCDTCYTLVHELKIAKEENNFRFGW